jgi:hypothetical protein
MAIQVSTGVEARQLPTLKRIVEMPRKTQARKKPWRLRAPLEAIRPKGPPEMLLRAMQQLAPYRGVDVAFEDGVVRKLSKRTAKQFIIGIARRYNYNEYVARDAPRFSDVLKRLEGFETLCAELAEYIDGSDELTLRILQLGFSKPDRKDRLGTLMRAAEVEALKQVRGTSSLWARRLGSLSKCAGLCRERLLNRRAWQGRSISDRGGRTNMFKEDEGIPRWRLVTDLLYIHELFKPGLATTTEGKSFHTFVLNVFEYATGKEGETFAKVDYWIKRLVRATRQEEALRIQARALDDEIDRMILNTRLSKKRMEKILAMTNEVKTINAKRYRLWEITWPHYKIPGLASAA